jgi:N-methylhydantoinase A
VAADTETGERMIVKCASTPRAPEEGVLAALDMLFERFTAKPRIEYLAHSTTIATNALLGQMHLELPRAVFLTTRGFRDVIEIGRQNRSEVYNLFVTRPRPLVAREDRIAVNERIDVRGNVLVALTEPEITRVIEEIRRRAPQAIAIGLLHSYQNDAHERRLADEVRRAFPNIPVTSSSQVDREYREYERFSTTVVNAVLLPVVASYLERLRNALRKRGIDQPLYVMQSNGGMVAAAHALRPAALIESGPASGVIAAAQLAKTSGTSRVLSFDMGGTTAKAGTIIEGMVQVAGEFEAAGHTHSGRSVKGSGYPVRFPFVDLAEVSAGGGTIAWIDEAGALRVGPISAGADPGPACYGQSDRATVTDANVVLGRLNPQALAGGTFPIQAQRAHAAIGHLSRQIGMTPDQTAAGIVDIVDAQMAKVLRIVTVERGLDPRDFVLVAFGGNGPLHACALARELGMRRVMVPAQPGVFSAHGLLTADLRADLVHPLLREAHRLTSDQVDAVFRELETKGSELLRVQGVPEERMQFIREFDARYRGQSFELTLAHRREGESIAGEFHSLHRRRYGYDVPEETVELVNARLGALATLPELPAHSRNSNRTLRDRTAHREVYIAGRRVQTPVYRREDLPEIGTLTGPVLIEQYDTCTYVAPGWVASEHSAVMLLERND